MSFSHNQTHNTTQSTPISHTKFNMLNILMGMGCIIELKKKKGYIMEWPHIVRIICMFLKLQLPQCRPPKQSLAPPPPTPSIHSTSLNHPQILSCCQEPASPFSWLQTLSFNRLFHFFQKPQIFPSHLVNNQLLMEAAHKWFTEDKIFLTS